MPGGGGGVPPRGVARIPINGRSQYSEHTQGTSREKTIWSCWFQGREAAPHLVKRCFSSWERENPGWHFRCLDAVSIERYIDLKGIVDFQSQSMTAASFSDILRISYYMNLVAFGSTLHYFAIALLMNGYLAR
jgi:Capsular polysaccharide synthesis protein